MGNNNSVKRASSQEIKKRNANIPFNYILHNEIERSLKSRLTISESKSVYSSTSRNNHSNKFKRSHITKKLSSIKSISNMILTLHKINTDKIHKINTIETLFITKSSLRHNTSEPNFSLCEPITKTNDNSISMFLSPEEADIINQICKTDRTNQMKSKRKSLHPLIPTIKIDLKELSTDRPKKTMTKCRTKNVLGVCKYKNKMKKLEDDLFNITEIKDNNDRYDTNDNSQTFIDMVDDFRSQFSSVYNNENINCNSGKIIFMKKKVQDRFNYKHQ